MRLWEREWMKLLVEKTIISLYGANQHNCFIGDGVKLAGQKIVIWPNVTLDGDITVSSDCVFEKSVTVIGKITLAHGVVMKQGVKITGEGFIGENSVIGHDIHDPKIGKNCVIDGLVIESEIGDDCVVGNFAEIKRSKLGSGVKAKHVCGIRDAEVGAFTNIASETDIKNYDGVEKYKTVIGSRCFLAGTIIGGVRIGDEVRIHPEMLVKENLPSMSYYAYTVKEYRSWNLEGYFLNLDAPIPYLNRLHFIQALERKLGYKFTYGQEPIDKNLDKYLNTENSHLCRTPLRALEYLGCEGILCLLGECSHKRPRTTNPA